MGSTIVGAPQMFGNGNVVNPIVAVIPSATTINPTDIVNRITGNTNVSTIVPPNPYWNGPLYFINTDAVVGTWDAAGNVALAGTFTQNKLFIFMFDPGSGKWYPNNVS